MPPPAGPLEAAPRPAGAAARGGDWRGSASTSAPRGSAAGSHQSSFRNAPGLRGRSQIRHDGRLGQLWNPQSHCHIRTKTFCPGPRCEESPDPRAPPPRPHASGSSSSRGTASPRRRYSSRSPRRSAAELCPRPSPEEAGRPGTARWSSPSPSPSRPPMRRSTARPPPPPRPPPPGSPTAVATLAAAPLVPLVAARPRPWRR